MTQSVTELLEEAGITDDMGYKNTPLWDGPHSRTPQGGITFSLLSRYLVCKERARIHLMDGLKPRDQFNHRIEYGNMWHICEEVYAKHKMIEGPLASLYGYAEQLCRRYPIKQDEIFHWYNVCKIQFPIYVEYWSKNKVEDSEPLFQEEAFQIPYTLPSGKVVFLRGKWDSIALHYPDEILIQENKTKGDIDPPSLQKQLKFDLQTMIYLVALHQFMRTKDFPYQIEGNVKVNGIIYNVVRRPLSGGRGNISQKKGSKNVPPETKDEYYNRLKTVIDGSNPDYETDPSYFFMRWKIEIDPKEVNYFRKVCLDPILENLCNDYEWWRYCMENQKDVFNHKLREERFPEDHKTRHHVYPFGIFNSLTEGDGTAIDEYLFSGNTMGLERSTNLFPELQT